MNDQFNQEYFDRILMVDMRLSKISLSGDTSMLETGDTITIEMFFNMHNSVSGGMQFKIISVNHYGVEVYPRIFKSGPHQNVQEIYSVGFGVKVLGKPESALTYNGLLDDTPKLPDHNDASIITYGQAIFNSQAEMMKAQGDLYSEMARSGTLRGKAGPIKTAEDKPLNPKLFISGKHNFISRQYER